MIYEWDERKRIGNLEKHGLDFTDAWKVYEASVKVTLPVPHTESGEVRWMDVAEMGERPVTEISGGERQRVVIARALAQEPDILILDEPTASLDIAHQVEIYHILTRLNEERGLTIILSSHDLNLAAQYCHRMILINKGRIYAAGTPSEVITEEHIREVYGCPVLVDAHPVSGGPRLTLLPVNRQTMPEIHKVS